MTIKISQFNSFPAISFDEIHISEFRILFSEEQVDKAQMTIIFKLIGRDAQGKKYFDTPQHTIIVSDIIDESKTKQTLDKALKAIEDAVAEKIKEQGSFGNTTITR